MLRNGNFLCTFAHPLGSSKFDLLILIVDLFANSTLSDLIIVESDLLLLDHITFINLKLNILASHTSLRLILLESNLKCSNWTFPNSTLNFWTGPSRTEYSRIQPSWQVPVSENLLSHSNTLEARFGVDRDRMDSRWSSYCKIFTCLFFGLSQDLYQKAKVPL